MYPAFPTCIGIFKTGIMQVGRVQITASLKKLQHRTGLSPFPYLPTSGEPAVKVCEVLAPLDLLSQQQVPDLRLRQAR
ncbi:hypothetical protein VN97_g10838 [Penicillium thymicola]|uniref:Uncharacterized protein n=1 Tax=Penicillium thymicola TaxID=293382 RepID=A0AAI9T933_PENTH|nr:hypothetical protein VN97_g10838 [Penicillium thymicola]